jgi:hypothetical protein
LYEGSLSKYLARLFDELHRLRESSLQAHDNETLVLRGHPWDPQL